MIKKKVFNIIFGIMLLISVPLPMVLGVLGVADPSGGTWRLIMAIGVYLVATIASIRLIVK